MTPLPADPAAPASMPPAPAAEPRQRWRLAYARHLPATGETAGREYSALWEGSLAASGLPLVGLAPGRPKIAFASPLPLGIAARRELLDFWLTDVRAAWRVRAALGAVLPPDHAIVDLENVWLGAPALPGRVVGADYLVTLGEADAVVDLDAAAGRLLAEQSLPRERAKGSEVKAYDLRPLLGDVAVVARSPVVVRIRTLAIPDLGTGRPDEVLAALGEAAGITLTPREIVRERLVLADDAP